MNDLKSVPRQAGGYKMINEAEFKNFRGYKNAKLKDCRRINLIVGENGIGKTSLLEGLFLAAGGSVEVALRLRQWRGYEPSSVPHTIELEESLWRDFFHNFDKKTTVSISLVGTEYRNRAMTIKFNDLNPSTIQISRKGKSEDVDVAPITFDWIGPLGRRAIVKPKIKDGKLQLPPVAILPEETYFFAASHNYSASETASRFSELSKTFQEKKVVRRFQQHFPDVSDLSIEIIGGTPMVCAKYHDLPEKVPLNLISSGMSKIASILFAIGSKKGSVLLIDEIENGVFHERLPIFWESLLDFCEANDSQVFASTHSGECIDAAGELAAKHPDEFCLIQPNGRGELNQVSGKNFQAAIKNKIEIR